MEKFRRLIAVCLLGMVGLMSSGVGIAGAAAELQHEFEQSQAQPGDRPSPGSEGAHCGHGCVGHLSAHLFSVPGGVRALAVPPVGANVVPLIFSQVESRLSDRFFKPPRIS